MQEFVSQERSISRHEFVFVSSRQEDEYEITFSTFLLTKYEYFALFSFARYVNIRFSLNGNWKVWMEVCFWFTWKTFFLSEIWFFSLCMKFLSGWMRLLWYYGKLAQEIIITISWKLIYTFEKKCGQGNR